MEHTEIIERCFEEIQVMQNVIDGLCEIVADYAEEHGVNAVPSSGHYNPGGERIPKCYLMILRKSGVGGKELSAPTGAVEAVTYLKGMIDQARSGGERE